MCARFGGLKQRTAHSQVAVELDIARGSHDVERGAVDVAVGCPHVHRVLHGVNRHGLKGHGECVARLQLPQCQVPNLEQRPYSNGIMYTPLPYLHISAHTVVVHHDNSHNNCTVT